MAGTGLGPFSAPENRARSRACGVDKKQPPLPKPDAEGVNPAVAN